MQHTTEYITITNDIWYEELYSIYEIIHPAHITIEPRNQVNGAISYRTHKRADREERFLEQRRRNPRPPVENRIARRATAAALRKLA